NKAIDRFANLLADEFYSRIQPELASEHYSKKSMHIENKKELKSKKNNAQTVNQAVASAISEFRKFRKSQRLGIYGKARLHMKFMERLTELGYEHKIAKKLNEEILFKTH
ncbi:MAG: hypothetical protein P8090_16870, partial [Gammaproteobacteria bacterium]